MRSIVNICLLIAVYYFVYYIYVGHLNPLPLDGDSWDYHIPIAASILDGSFLTHPHQLIPQWHRPNWHSSYNSAGLPFIPQWYYPGSSEAINALFLLFHIPTFSNIFATIILCFCLWKLAQTFRLSSYYSLLFAITFCTLNVILRWLNVVSIDVWVRVWFALSIILLENPKQSLFYFVKLGFVLGMLIGSKYTAAYFIALLFGFYIKSLLRYINIQRLLGFLVPFTAFGLFWYIRNYFLTGNPFYPLPRFGFKGPLTFDDTVWIETIHHPLAMLNAGFGEYHLWFFSFLIAIVVLFYQFVIKKKFILTPINKLFLIGLVNLVFYFSFPTSSQTWIMVSSFRYSLPTFIPLMLGIFMLGQKNKKDELLGYFVVANMINVLTMTYYPKLIFIYLPISLGLFYILTQKQKRKFSILNFVKFKSLRHH